MPGAAPHAGEQRALAQHETASLEAYDAFLRGWDHYQRSTPEDLVKAPPFRTGDRAGPDYGRAQPRSR